MRTVAQTLDAKPIAAIVARRVCELPYFLVLYDPTLLQVLSYIYTKSTPA